MAIQRASIDEYMKSVQSQQQMGLASVSSPNGTVKNYYMLQTPEPIADNNMTMILLGVVAMVMISAIAIVALSKKR